MLICTAKRRVSEPPGASELPVLVQVTVAPDTASLLATAGDRLVEAQLGVGVDDTKVVKAGAASLRATLLTGAALLLVAVTS